MAAFEAAARDAQALPGQCLVAVNRTSTADIETLLASVYGAPTTVPPRELELVVVPAVVGRWYGAICAGAVPVAALCERPGAAEVACALYESAGPAGLYRDLTRLAAATAELCTPRL